jgi:hypothetical protein
MEVRDLAHSVEDALEELESHTQLRASVGLSSFAPQARPFVIFSLFCSLLMLSGKTWKSRRCKAWPMKYRISEFPRTVVHIRECRLIAPASGSDVHARQQSKAPRRFKMYYRIRTLQERPRQAHLLKFSSTLSDSHFLLPSETPRDAIVFKIAAEDLEEFWRTCDWNELR